jgi:hypothetical protein
MGVCRPCRCFKVYILASRRSPASTPASTANMHTTALLTMLFAAVTSAQLNYCTGNKQTLGHCHTLSFTDVTTTTANALNSTACNDTCRTMFWDAGDWLVDLRGLFPFPFSSSSPLSPSNISSAPPLLRLMPPRQTRRLPATHDRLPRLRLQHGCHPQYSP